MRGHENLIALRMRGAKPANGVRISTDDQDADWPRQHRALYAKLGVVPGTAELHIGQAEDLGLLDLRPLVGLTVTVDGMLARRVRMVCRAALAAGAKRVLGNVYIPRKEGAEVIEIMDSEGVMTWRE